MYRHGKNVRVKTNNQMCKIELCFSFFFLLLNRLDATYDSEWTVANIFNGKSLFSGHCRLFIWTSEKKYLSEATLM